MESGRFKVVMAAQPANELSAMAVSVMGNSMLPNTRQPAKAPLPMLASPSGNLKVFRARQPSNA